MITVRPRFLSDCESCLRSCQMHAGGHVPRRSVSSLAEVALCVQVERNQRTALPVCVPQFDMELLVLQRSLRISLG